MNIIVTGASRGIGFETVLAMAKSGKHTIIAIARTLEKLQILQEKISQTESTLYTFSYDLNQEDYTKLIKNIDKIVSQTNSKSIDILINNAGYLVNKTFLQLDTKDWYNIFETNVFSVARLIKYLIPYLSRSKAAHIVNIASMGGIQGSEKFAGLSAYSASKGALNIMTECLAVELLPYSISVNAISPGATQTEMLQQAFPGFTAEISAKQMGEFIAHFALHNAKLMNGRLIEVSLKG